MSETQTVTSDLDVLSKYNSLVKESLGSDSAYIRAKETVDELVSAGSLDEAKKAEVIIGILGSVVNSVTNASMSTAVEWAKYEKELSLKKLEMDQQLLILGQEKLLKEAQVAQLDIQNKLSKVESKRMYGTATFDVGTGALISLAGEGKVWQDMQLVTQQVVNAKEEETLLKSKVNESKVAIHKVVADTYTNFGSFTFAYDGSGNGISSVTRLDASTSLSDTQQQIAIEQGKGYTYNAWANALTGSASMLGTAIASGDFSFSAGSNELKLFDAVVNCAENLSAASSAVDEAVPA